MPYMYALYVCLALHACLICAKYTRSLFNPSRSLLTRQYLRYARRNRPLLPYYRSLLTLTHTSARTRHGLRLWAPCSPGPRRHLERHGQVAPPRLHARADARAVPARQVLVQARLAAGAHGMCRERARARKSERARERERERERERVDRQCVYLTCARVTYMCA